MRKAVTSLIKSGFAEEIEVTDIARSWREQGDRRLGVFITDAGRAILVAEPMSDTRGAPSVSAYFAFYLLAMGSGRPRDPQRLGEMLRSTGFVKVRRHRTHSPLVAQVISARKPG